MREQSVTLKTAIAEVTADDIQIYGHSLMHDIMGKATFTELIGLLLIGEWPQAGRARMLDALLASLTEHGMTSSVIAGRLIFHSSPEAIQGAVATSLLAAGSRHLGTSESAARMLQEALSARGSQALSELAEGVVTERLAAKEVIPGIGHPNHRQGDPRAQRLFEIAQETDCFGDHCRLMVAISEAAERRHGKARPVNVTGAVGAIWSELGCDWRLAKSAALLGRCLGMLGHIREELSAPMGPGIVSAVNALVAYEP